MDPYWTAAGVTLYHGDCLDVLRTLPDCSIDAVVTDPPYGLEFMGREWDSFGHKIDNFRSNDGYDRLAQPVQRGARTGAMPAFQQWCEAWATECLRVLKPGGHLLAFGGTRTWHRLACAVEDAGFEMRDSIAWLYGSGFPKSLDVSKAIDKARDDNLERRAVGLWLRAQREAAGLLQKDIAKHWPSVTGGLTGCVANWEGGFNCPTWDQWLKLRELIGFSDEMDAEVWRLNGRKGTPGEAWERREVVGSASVPVGHAFAGTTYGGDSSERSVDVTAPATDDARTWQGWGTALKPAHEPIVVARKPLAGTVAANVLTHGTGALNVDACRVAATGRPSIVKTGAKSPGSSFDTAHSFSAGITDQGRWPANVVLDEDAAAALDRQSGVLHTQATRTDPARGGEGGMFGIASKGVRTTPDAGSAGGASRFFYVAKAPAAERPHYWRHVCDCEHDTPATAGGACPACGTKFKREAHPTVKPVDLMRWLVRLVTPPGGTVLDVFAGSGATGEAAKAEGFPVILIEREADYVPLIRQRFDRKADPVAYLASKGEDGGLFDLL